MVFIYNIGVLGLRLAYRVACLFSPKARAFRDGRINQKEAFEVAFPLKNKEKLIWFHCASLGEFEQSRPVLEAIRAWNPTLKILLTFFSPSGYEVGKQYKGVDFVFYLPWDTSRNAHLFVESVQPSLAIFVKYEFWHHYTINLHQRNIPLISISSIFRSDQIFFKAYGSFFRNILKHFRHFFVQNQKSVELLQSIGITAVSQNGDTRFDRVDKISQSEELIPLAQQFKNGKRLMVVGSVWPEDMNVLIPFINEYKGDLKFIVAPHEISEDFISSIEKAIQGIVVRYSKASETSVRDAVVLVIDNIGLLSRLYRYGDVAYVGGAFGQGLHNILEAATYGIPIFFGNRGNEKYQEAIDLVEQGGAFEVADFAMLKSTYSRLMANPEILRQACNTTSQYVLNNRGATDRILAYCKKTLA